MAWWTENTAEKIRREKALEAESRRNATNNAAAEALATGRTTDELRGLAINEELREDAEKLGAQIEGEIQRYVAHHPGYIVCPLNQDRISSALTAVLSENFLTFGPHLTHEMFTCLFHQAVDKVHKNGELIYEGTYERLTPTDAEAYKMDPEDLKDWANHREPDGAQRLR